MGQGLQLIPFRIPEQWSAAWYAKHLREVLALADARNSLGNGVEITGQSGEVATFSVSEDIRNLLLQPFVLASPSGFLTQERILAGESGVIGIDDGGPDSDITVGIEDYGINLGKLKELSTYGVLGNPVDGIGAVQNIDPSTDGEAFAVQSGEIVWTQTPVWTGAHTWEYASPEMLFTNTAAGADEGKWRSHFTATEWHWSAETDDGLTHTHIFTAARTGADIDQLTLLGALIQLSGDTQVVGQVLEIQSGGARFIQHDTSQTSGEQAWDQVNLSGALAFRSLNDAHSSATERFEFGPDGQLGIAGANYGTAGQIFASGGASAAPAWTSFSSYLANPTGLIGMTAVNGTADTATRSDATHAIDPAIAPVWTGNHDWVDDAMAQFGTGLDLSIFHDGTNSIVENDTGLLRFYLNSATQNAMFTSNTDWDISSSNETNNVIAERMFKAIVAGTASAPTFKAFSYGSTGTRASPAALSSSDGIFALDGGGYDGSAFSARAFIRGFAGEAWTTSAHGTYYNFGTCALGVVAARAVVGVWSNGGLRLMLDNAELSLGAGSTSANNSSGDLRLYHDGTNSIVRTDTGGLRLQFSTSNRFEVNTTGVGFNGATPIARPDYTITNPTTNRSIDVTAITLAQLAQVVGTMIQDNINYGLYQ